MEHFFLGFGVHDTAARNKNDAGCAQSGLVVDDFMPSSGPPRTLCVDHDFLPW